MTTIFTVGTGGDFATIQAAYNAIPEPLDDQYIIQLKNQEFVFTGASVALACTARTTTAAFDIIIECEPGASFMDNASVRANALRYNPANGAAIRTEDAGAILFVGVANHLTIRGIQIKQQATAASSFDIIQGFAADTSTNRVLQDLIVEQSGSDHNDCMFLTGQNTVINCCVIHGGNNPDSAIKVSDAAAGYRCLAVGCTVVRPSNLADEGIGLFNKFADNVFVAIDCAVFGFLTDASQLTATDATFGTTDYNATPFADGASGFPDPVPDHNVYSVPYDTTLFEQPSNAGGNQDYRLKSGSLLVAAGIASAFSPQDISGFTRGNPPDIGAWETSSAAPGGGHFRRNRIDQFIFGDDDDLLFKHIWARNAFAP
jgi:hypothetical protein